MKTTTRSNIYLLMAAIILMAAFAVPAAAQKQVPFKGAMQGSDTAHTPGTSPGAVVVTTSVTGIATHVGQFSFSQECTVNIVVAVETCSAHWTAANGDSFDTAIAGSAEPTTTADVLSITEIHHITSGTGQFAGAQGSFILHRLHIGVSFFTSGSFEGTITSPGAAN
jgi:type IV secretory pathway VirB2 component (pilin)